MKFVDNFLCNHGYHKDIEFIKNSSIFSIPERFWIIARCKNCRQIIAEWEVENIDFFIKKQGGE